MLELYICDKLKTSCWSVYDVQCLKPQSIVATVFVFYCLKIKQTLNSL